MKTSSIRMWYLTAAVAVVAGCVSCKETGADTSRSVVWWEGEQEREDVAQAVELARYRVAQLPADRTGDLARVKAETATLKSRLVEVRKIHASLEAEVAAVSKEADAYAAMVREQRRADAVGSKMAFFKPAVGRGLEDVEITAVNDAGVTMRHRGGITRVDFFKLTPGQRERFGLEFASATVALDQERAEQLAFHQASEAALAVQREAEASESAAAAKREASQARQSKALVAVQTVQRSSPLAQSPGRPNGTQRATRPYRQRSTIYYYPYSPYYYPCSPVRPYVPRVPITPSSLNNRPAPVVPLTPPATGGCNRPTTSTTTTSSTL